MASEKFTRDEVILALDVLYSSPTGKLSANSPEVKDLSDLLNRLPIYPKHQFSEGFRTIPGILQQLKTFKRSIKKGEKGTQVGKIFFDIAFEFEDDIQALHNTAQAIRKNEMYFSSPYSDLSEYIFREGALLGHLHTCLEQKALQNFSAKDCCEICCFKPELQYKNCGKLLQLHLTIPPEQMVGNKKYDESCFITVCPTCHTALHRYRPWLTKENCGEILC